jgi:AcrR family transcriptional regulator
MAVNRNPAPPPRAPAPPRSSRSAVVAPLGAANDLAERAVGRALSASEERLRALRARREREYEALLEAGHRVLLRRGYHQTRVDDIMREAGISTRAFYRFCTGKDDLFLALFDRSNVAAMERLAERVAHHPRPSDQLDVYIDSTLDLAYKDRLRPEVRLFLTVPSELTVKYSREVIACREQLVSLLRDILERGRASGDFPSAAPEDDAWAISGALGSVMSRVVLSDDPPPRARVAKRLRQFCRAALVGE